MKNNTRFSYALDTLERGHLSDPKASHFYGDPYVPASLADKFDENFIFLAQLRLDMLKGWDSEELPEKKAEKLFKERKLFERTEDTEYMLGMWSENGFTEAEKDYWLNPDNH